MWIPTKPSPSQWKKGTYLLLALFALLLCGHFLCGNGAVAQKSLKQNQATVEKCIKGDSVLWMARVQYLGYIAQKLRQSDLPSKETSFIIDSLIAPMQVDIYQQINKKQ